MENNQTPWKTTENNGLNTIKYRLNMDSMVISHVFLRGRSKTQPQWGVISEQKDSERNLKISKDPDDPRFAEKELHAANGVVFAFFFLVWGFHFAVVFVRPRQFFVVVYIICCFSLSDL